MEASTTSDHDLERQGYAVYERVCPGGDVFRIRSAISKIVQEVQPQSLFEPETRQLSEAVSLTPTGLAIDRLFKLCPHLVSTVLRPEVIASLRTVLGSDMRLELVGAAVSDETRPFFRWHTHIGGVEERERLREQAWPAVDGVRRVLCLLYLDDLDEDGGPLLVLPRRVGDPTAPPGDIDARSWPGEAEIRAPAGTVVALDQCTWHAARSRRGTGLRMFVGAYFAAADEPWPEWGDRAMHTVRTTDRLFRSLVR